MSSYKSRTSSMASSRSSPSPLQPAISFLRLPSTSNTSTTHFTNPRVQLVPHSRKPSHDGSLSPEDNKLLANTYFDSKDVSSKDFDFEDVFTYDKPQRKLKSVIEVSPSSRDWTSYPFPHRQTSFTAMHKPNRQKSTSGELYLKNKSDIYKR